MKKPVIRDAADAENEGEAVNKKVSADLLDGLTFMTRRINIGKERAEIRTIDFDTGLMYKGPLWKDPYVSYKQQESGLKEESAGNLPDPSSWLNIKTLFIKENSIPDILIYSKGLGATGLTTYSLWHNKAKGLQMAKNEYALNDDILFDDQKKEEIISAVEIISSFGSTLSAVITSVLKTKSGESKIKPENRFVRWQFLTGFYDNCRKDFDYQIATGISDYNGWIENIIEESLRTYNNFEHSFCNSAETMSEIIKAKALLMKKRSKFLKEIKRKEDPNHDQVVRKS